MLAPLHCWLAGIVGVTQWAKLTWEGEPIWGGLFEATQTFIDQHHQINYHNNDTNFNNTIINNNNQRTTYSTIHISLSNNQSQMGEKLSLRHRFHS